MPNPPPAVRFVEGYTTLSTDMALEILLKAKLVRRLTSKEIATAMGVSPSVVSRLERSGRKKGRKPSFSLLQRYAQAMGLELRLAVTGADGRALL